MVLTFPHLIKDFPVYGIWEDFCIVSQVIDINTKQIDL